MATVPEKYGSGTVPAIGDTKRMLMVKEVLATTGSGGGSGGAGIVGHGSPQNVVVAPAGTAYLDQDTGNFWFKQSGSGSSGWLELIGS